MPAILQEITEQVQGHNMDLPVKSSDWVEPIVTFVFSENPVSILVQKTYEHH